MATEDTKNIVLRRYKKRVIVSSIMCSIIAVFNVVGCIAILGLCEEELGLKIGCIVFVVIVLAVAIIVPFAFFKSYKNYADNIEDRIKEIDNSLDVDEATTSEEVAKYIACQDNVFNKSNSFAKRKGLFRVILLSTLVLMLVCVAIVVISSLDNDALKSRIITISIILVLVATFSFGIFKKLFRSSQASKMEKMFDDIDGYVYNNFYRKNMKPDEYIDHIPIIGKMNYAGEVFDQVKKENNDWIYTELKIEEKGYGKGGGISLPIFNGGILEVPAGHSVKFNTIIADVNNKEIWPNGYNMIQTEYPNFDKVFKVLYEPVPALSEDGICHFLSSSNLDNLINLYQQTGGCSFIISNKKVFMLLNKVNLFRPKTSHQELVDNLHILDKNAMLVKETFALEKLDSATAKQQVERNGANA